MFLLMSQPKNRMCRVALILSIVSIVLIALLIATSTTNVKVIELKESAGVFDRLPARVVANVYVYVNGELVAKSHNIIVNSGMAALRDAVHGGTAATAQYIALSTDSTAPAYTDTSCPGEITSGGLERALATVTTQSGPSNGDITVRLEKTFTATSSHSNVQKACVFTAITGGTLYAVATFTPVSLEANWQITIRWDFTYQN